MRIVDSVWAEESTLRLRYPGQIESMVGKAEEGDCVYGKPHWVSRKGLWEGRVKDNLTQPVSNGARIIHDTASFSAIGDYPKADTRWRDVCMLPVNFVGSMLSLQWLIRQGGHFRLNSPQMQKQIYAPSIVLFVGFFNLFRDKF